MQWYFDFISPYAYLQSCELRERVGNTEIECKPVLFAGLLNHWSNVGPAEIAPKRDWTFKRVAYLAHRQGVALNLPSKHPFNPLPLLRLSIALGNDLDTVERLFKFVWAEGNLPEGEAFNELLAELNVTEEQLRTQEVKDALHANGRTAAEKGIFGVPTLEAKGELFWGHDSLDMALDYVNEHDWPAKAVEAAATLPTGLQRKPKISNAGDTTRLPLLPIDLSEPADLVAAIRQRRGGELIELDRLLLYSAPLAEGWNAFIGNVRTKFTLPQQYRELAMCTVAVVNGADYEYTQHAPLYISSGGDKQRAEALTDLGNIKHKIDLFERKEQLTIALTEQMTRDVQVDQSLFVNCQASFSDTELVELIATIAAYNMVSRFLVALNLH